MTPPADELSIIVRVRWWLKPAARLLAPVCCMMDEQRQSRVIDWLVRRAVYVER